MNIYIILLSFSVIVVIISIILYKKKIRKDSPMNLYRIEGGNADVWWNGIKVTGPDTINPLTDKPFIKQHIRNITIKAKQTPLRVYIPVEMYTYSKVKIHTALNELTGRSKLYTNEIVINDTNNYYTIEGIQLT